MFELMYHTHTHTHTQYSKSDSFQLVVGVLYSFALLDSKHMVCVTHMEAIRHIMYNKSQS